MARALLALLLSALAASAAGESAVGVDPVSPEGVVRELYRRQMVPTDAEKAIPRYGRYDGLLGRGLALAIAAQQDYEAVCASVAPRDTKPYQIEQDLFDGTPDGARTLESTTGRIFEDQYARVEARLTYDADYGWTNAVLLAREDGRWVVVDVVFESGERLTQVLREFATHRCYSG